MVKNLPLGTGHKTVSPELNTRSSPGGITFKTGPVYRYHRDAVRNGMTALDSHPGVKLSLLLSRCIFRIPSDGSRVDKQLCPCQSHEPGCFRVPLIPADQNTKPADRRLDRGETEVARGEVEFFVKARVIRNMHFAVDSGDGAVTFDDDSGVMVQAGGTPLKE